MTKPELSGRLRHLAYAGGWKKFEPLWDFVIRAKQVTHFLPFLEAILSSFHRLDPERVSQEKMRLEPEAVEGGSNLPPVL